MNLADYERAIQRVCAAPEPHPDDLSLLGDNPVWLVYREMVRRRLRLEVARVFKRTHGALGADRFDALFDAALAASPPHSRYFYQVPLWFAEAVAPALRADATVPAYGLDLLRYEAARWEVADLPAQVDPAPREFAFDAAAVVSPALRMLTVGHAVHRAPDADGHYAAGTFHLLLCRAGDDAPVRAWAVPPLHRDLIVQLQHARGPVTEVVSALAAAHDRVVDAAFVDTLCGVLADFLQQGVLLGAR